MAMMEVQRCHAAPRAPEVNTTQSPMQKPLEEFFARARMMLMGDGEDETLLPENTDFSYEEPVGPYNALQDSELVPETPVCNLWQGVLLGLADACTTPLSFLGHEREAAKERLRLRLVRHGMEERPIPGDGNCQFASVSDQIYGTPKHHKKIRAVVVKRLKADPERYSPYILEQTFEDYLKSVATSGTWGDHVTLQALADAFGLRVMLVTSFAQDTILEIQPCEFKTKRVLWLAFLAEAHYSSLYKRGEAPVSAADPCIVC